MMTDPLTWVADDRFRVRGTEFVIAFGSGSTADRFLIRKRRELVQDYVDVLLAHRGANVVELGIAQGGSAALFALVGEPRKLIALELSDQPVVALAELVERHDLADTVRPYYGVDQGDRARVAAIVAAELGDEPLDLVIDDASHLLEPTRASFEVLFPRLRPGGLFLIEDWSWQHKLASGFRQVAGDPSDPKHDEVRRRIAEELRQPDSPARAALRRRLALVADDPTSPEYAALQAGAAAAMATPGWEPPPAPPAGSGSGDRPLTRLVVELLLARASSGEVVAEIEVGPWWVSVRRGPAHIDPATFRVADLARDHFGLLVP
jgi:predicted O-methyltransferase YrrM